MRLRSEGEQKPEADKTKVTFETEKVKARNINFETEEKKKI